MREIALPCGAVAIVDEADYPAVCGYEWRLQRDHISGRPAAVVAGGNGNHILMHRVVFGECLGMLVDHKDRNPLNNRRDNLRACSIGENSRNRGIAKHNRSGFKGIYADRNRWRAEINVDRMRIRPGSFQTKEEAAAAYDEAALRFHGEFAVTNADLRKAS